MSKYYTSNPIAKTITVSSFIVFGAGAIGGYVLGNGLSYATGSFSWGAAFGVWIAAFVLGITLLGLGEIIQILQNHYGEAVETKELIKYATTQQRVNQPTNNTSGQSQSTYMKTTQPAGEKPRFCQSCGAKLPATSTINVCATCFNSHR